MASHDLISLLQWVVQAFNDRELDFLEQSVTEGFTRHDLAGAFLAQRIGGAEVMNFLQALLGAIPDLRLNVMDMVPSDDRVTMRYQFSGTHKGTLFEIPPPGRPVEFSGINIPLRRGEDRRGPAVVRLHQRLAPDRSARLAANQSRGHIIGRCNGHSVMSARGLTPGCRRRSSAGAPQRA